MKRLLWLTCSLCLSSLATAQYVPVDDSVLKAIAEETSGESAKRNLDRITLYHRTRASSQFRAAAEHVQSQLEDYGFDNARILEYPADGSTMYGTQKSRLGWEVESAELWETDASGNKLRRLADWESMPLTLAQDSISGKANTTLIDIGSGTSETDYKGKDIRGKLVLTESQPEAVADLAVGRYGAAGIVSYAPNQKSAWWKQDDRLVRWGHLSSFPKSGSETFAFMISLGEARALRERLAKGETVHLNAQVKATRSPGVYSLVEATINGTDSEVADQQIVLTCHLDHPRPGANDNASGCVSILESARTLRNLIKQQRIPALRRSIRFVFPAEIEGSLIYLNADPELASRIKANIHMDMVGGDVNTKSVYRISTGPFSLPSFIPDVARAIGEFVNRQTLAYAGSEAVAGPDAQAVAYPLVSKEGSKEPLQAEFEALSMGSDHDIYREGSWRIPGIYLHDWPDRYIHTNFDTAANIDPTKLKRSAFIGAVSAYYLANLDADDIPALLSLVEQGSLRRAGELVAARRGKSESDAAAITRAHWTHETDILASITEFAPIDAVTMTGAMQFVDGLQSRLGGNTPAPKPEGDLAIVFTRNPDVRGTMDAFGYSYLDDKLGEEKRAALSLQGEQAYEALNLVNGKRTVADINDWMLAEFGSSNARDVLAYLQALESVGLVSRKR